MMATYKSLVIHIVLVLELVHIQYIWSGGVMDLNIFMLVDRTSALAFRCTIQHLLYVYAFED